MPIKSIVKTFCLFSLLQLSISLTAVSHSWAASKCSEVFLSKNTLHDFYQDQYEKGISQTAKQDWQKELVKEWNDIYHDQAQGVKKIWIMRKLGFQFGHDGQAIAPTHAEFVKNYISILRELRIPEHQWILPAVVMRKKLDGATQFLLLTPGIDPWPKEPGWQIHSANEQFNIPEAPVIAAMGKNRFPLLEGLHDVFHFISFAMNPSYAELLAKNLNGLDVKSGSPLSRRLFFINEYLSLGNPAKINDMKSSFLFPPIKAGETQRPFTEIASFYESLPMDAVLSQAHRLLEKYETFLIDYGGAATRSSEKKNLMNTGYDSSYEFDKEVRVFLHFLGARRVDNAELAEDQLSGLSPFLLKQLILIREMPVERLQDLTERNGYPANFLKDSRETDIPLAHDYKIRLESLIRLQLARMEYAAWESANSFPVEVWIQDGVSNKKPSTSKLHTFIRNAFGPQSVLYRSFLEIESD